MNNNFIKLAIIGNPLEHSISPTIQNAALQSVNLNGCYKKFEIDIDIIKSQINYFINNGYLGFNVTIPYKVEIIKYLNRLDTLAQKIGAVNTVKIEKNGDLIGYNTDIYGFVQGIENPKLIHNAKIIGAGGAALAVIFGLDSINCSNITLYVRDVLKTNILIESIKSKISANIEVKSLSDLKDISNTDILINATPLGTKGSFENLSPINDDIIKTADKNILIYDLVYNPQETKLIQIAKKYNLDTVSGLNMLINQGAQAFEIWTGIKPNTNMMKNAALSELIK